MGFARSFSICLNKSITVIGKSITKIYASKRMFGRMSVPDVRPGKRGRCGSRPPSAADHDFDESDARPGAAPMRMRRRARLSEKFIAAEPPPP